jgi:hypothetical protein
MKSVTEFPNFTLNKGLAAKANLSAEGKTPEEIQTSLGETFKYEGDKLKHFINALDLAGQNATNLKRVLVLSFAEGENTPAKAVKVDEHHYLAEFASDAKYVAPAKEERGRGGKGGGGKGRGGDRPKSSPWGLSPEEKAAKGGKAGAAKAKA